MRSSIGDSQFGADAAGVVFVVLASAWVCDSLVTAVCGLLAVAIACRAVYG